VKENVIIIPRNCVSRIIIVLFFLQCGWMQSQIRLDEEPTRLYYNRTQRVKRFRDMKDMRDVCHVDKFMMGKRRFSGSFSYNFGRVLVDDGLKIHNEYRSAIAYFVRYRFFEEFCLNATLYTNFNRQANANWIGDYSFSVGRYNWRSRRLNFGYEDYGNHKYYDNFKTFANKFLEGYFYASYNHAPKKLNKWIRIDSTTSLRFVYFSRYSVNFRDENEQYRGGFFNGKPTGGISMRFTMFLNIYVESAVYLYLPGRKQPWDPDYTYGFGYFDWRAFRVSFTYGNWAINRFPWNKTKYGRYGFMDGNFRVVANWMW
jgi:hypothetical protein